MDEFTFRPVTRNDFPLLKSWLDQPHVNRWWNHSTSPAALEKDFGGAVDGTEPSQNFMILAQGHPIGLMQFCLLDDHPDHLGELNAITPVPPRTGSIDYFIGEPSYIGKGVGTAAISAFVATLWDEHPQMPGLLTSVAAGNPASWRMLQRVGFTRIASGDLPPDNPIDPPLHHLLWLARPAGPA